MPEAVQIAFDCLPLRSISRLDIPLDASPEYRAQCERLKSAIEKHGPANSYYLLRAHCVFHLANSEIDGMLRFRFEGTVLTDPGDAKAVAADLVIELTGHTCDDVPQPVAAWLEKIVSRAVQVEFDRYIAAGDLTAAVQKSETLRRQSDSDASFVGMYL